MSPRTRNPVTDRNVLRDLAKTVQDISQRPEQAEKARLWKCCNGLAPERPMVFADPQGGWTELDEQWVRLACMDPVAREIELQLRRAVVRDRHIPDDFPIENVFRVPPVVSGDSYNDYGIPLSATHPGEADGAYHIEPMVNSERDIRRLHFRPVCIDRQATVDRFHKVRDLIGDILHVEAIGRSRWRYGLTRVLIHMRGFEQMLLDFYENPGTIHSLMAFLRDDYEREIQIYEQAGAIGFTNYRSSVLGTGGIGYCPDLPERSGPSDSGGTHTCIAWGESQETVGVSPEQFEEFVLQYQHPLLKRFGLVEYGCCEGLERKVDALIRTIGNLRWIAVSPWADREIMADRIKDRYVYAYKPNPATLCSQRPQWNEAEKELRATLKIAATCPVHIVMKDTKTFHRDGERITKWCTMARNIAMGG